MAKCGTIFCVLVLLLALACWAGDAKRYVHDTQAADVNAGYKMALHLSAHGTNSCGGAKAPPLPPLTSRDDIVSTWLTDPTEGSPVDLDVFLVVFQYDSLALVEYGLNWPAAWGSAWATSKCLAPIAVGDIINPGDGMALAWGSPACWRTQFFIPAYTWLTATSKGRIEIRDFPDTLNGVPMGGSDNNGIIVCGGSTYDYPESVFFAYVGTDSGPYEGPPLYETEPSTWGAIKSIFR